MTEQQEHIFYAFPDKPVQILKDVEPKEVWLYIKGKWVKFEKEST